MRRIVMGQNQAAYFRHGSQLHEVGVRYCGPNSSCWIFFGM
jgi:hypothetical protein